MSGVSDVAGAVRTISHRPSREVKACPTSTAAVTSRGEPVPSARRA